MDGHAFEDDAPDGSPLYDDADASDAGDSEADAPGAIRLARPALASCDGRGVHAAATRRNGQPAGVQPLHGDESGAPGNG